MPLLLSLLLLGRVVSASAQPAAGNPVRKPAPGSAPRRLLVGYFGQWSLYSTPPYTLKDLSAHDGAASLDQINYAQGFVTGGHCSIADRNADLDYLFSASNSVNGQPDDPATAFHGHLHQLLELKRAFPGLKAVISLEGHAPDFAFDAQPENRKAFVASCIDLFVRGNLPANVSAPGLFDGIDLDWEYPGPADAANFLALLTEFRTQLNLVRPGLILSVAVGPNPRMYDGVDLSALAALVDQIGVMTYDFTGPWMHTTGFLAPLYSVPRPQLSAASAAPSTATTGAPTGANPTASTAPAAETSAPAGSAASSTPAAPPRGGAAASVEAFLSAGVPAGKLLLGVPFYGYGWTKVPEVDDGIFQEGTPVHGDRPYSYIQTLAAASTVFRDPGSCTPWLFDGDAFWTFDDPLSIRAKAAFAVEHALGGLMIWELSEDTPQATLLRAARQGLSHPPLATSCPATSGQTAQR